MTLAHPPHREPATGPPGRFRRRYRADRHGRVASGPEMMVALLLYGYCQGERSSRVIEKRCVRHVAYRVITGGLHPDHATIARFRARHETALGGLFSQVLRLLAAEGMVSLGLLSLDGTKLAGNAAQKANRTLPQIEKILAEAAAADAAEDARYGDAPGEPTPRALARRAGRRERLARARDRQAAEDQARRDAQRARQEAWQAAAAAGKRRGRRPGDEPRANRAGTEPRANITDPDVHRAGWPTFNLVMGPYRCWHRAVSTSQEAAVKRAVSGPRRAAVGRASRRGGWRAIWAALRPAHVHQREVQRSGSTGCGAGRARPVIGGARRLPRPLSAHRVLAAVKDEHGLRFGRLVGVTNCPAPDPSPGA